MQSVTKPHRQEQSRRADGAKYDSIALQEGEASFPVLFAHEQAGRI